MVFKLKVHFIIFNHFICNEDFKVEKFLACPFFYDVNDPNYSLLLLVTKWLCIFITCALLIGGPGGRVYQKAYVEFFASPDLTRAVFLASEKRPNIKFYAVDSSGNQLISNSG